MSKTQWVPAWCVCVCVRTLKDLIQFVLVPNSKQPKREGLPVFRHATKSPLPWSCRNCSRAADTEYRGRSEQSLPHQTWICAATNKGKNVTAQTKGSDLTILLSFSTCCKVVFKSFWQIDGPGKWTKSTIQTGATHPFLTKPTTENPPI